MVNSNNKNRQLRAVHRAVHRNDLADRDRVGGEAVCDRGHEPEDRNADPNFGNAHDVGQFSATCGKCLIPFSWVDPRWRSELTELNEAKLLTPTLTRRTLVANLCMTAAIANACPERG